jgi:hypothetical protein
MMMSLQSSLRSVRHISQRRFMAAMPKPQSMEAELWQGHPKHEEGWETTIYVTYGVTALLLGVTLFFSPETSIKTWASNEAQARLDLKGVELEFGKHYSDPDVKFDYDSFKPENPFNEEEDDDEEEEEEDDEEKEEEEDDDDE